MTIGFALSVFLLLAITLLFVLRPLLTNRTQQLHSRDTELLNAYQQKLEQLTQQHARNELDAAEHEAACNELEMALAEELPEATDEIRNEQISRWVPGSLAVALIIASVSLYYFLGRPDGLNSVNSQAANKQTTPSVEEMVTRLEQRLQQEPQDIQGWLMLGRSYTALQQPGRSLQAFAKALQLAPDNPEILMDYAEAQARDNGNIFSDDALAKLQQALSIDPQSRRGRWLLGIVNLQRGQRELAIERWTELLNESGTDSEDRQLLQQFIATAKGKPLQSAAEPSAKKPQQAAVNAAPHIRVYVSLADELKGRVDANDVLFIYAKAAAGPPMPLAIERRRAGELPIELILDDNDAMMEQIKLSSFSQVIVTARISKSGSATPVPGDLQGISSTIDPKTNPAITIGIKQTVP